MPPVPTVNQMYLHNFRIMTLFLIQDPGPSPKFPSMTKISLHIPKCHNIFENVAIFSEKVAISFQNLSIFPDFLGNISRLFLYFRKIGRNNTGTKKFRKFRCSKFLFSLANGESRLRNPFAKSFIYMK